MTVNSTGWDETSPVSADLVAEGPDNFRANLTRVRTRMAKEHGWPASQTSSNEAGWHTFITLSGQTAAPTLVYGAATTQLASIWASSGSQSVMVTDSAGNNQVLLAGSTDNSWFTPAGMMVPFAGTSSPGGWLLCTGGAFSRTTYARLYNVVGTVWGTGDGSTTFNIPDMQGYIPVGQSAGGGLFVTIAASTGAVAVALSSAEAPTLNVDLPTYSPNSGGSADSVQRGAGSPDGTLTVTATGGGQSHLNVQPSKVVLYIIKH